jgi:hypothetical protein
LITEAFLFSLVFGGLSYPEFAYLFEPGTLTLSGSFLFLDHWWRRWAPQRLEAQVFHSFLYRNMVRSRGECRR